MAITNAAPVTKTRPDGEVSAGRKKAPASKLGAFAKILDGLVAKKGLERLPARGVKLAKKGKAGEKPHKKLGERGTGQDWLAALLQNAPQSGPKPIQPKETANKAAAAGSIKKAVVTNLAPQAKKLDAGVLAPKAKAVIAANLAAASKKLAATDVDKAKFQDAAQNAAQGAAQKAAAKGQKPVDGKASDKKSMSAGKNALPPDNKMSPAAFLRAAAPPRENSSVSAETTEKSKEAKKKAKRVKLDLTDLRTGTGSAVALPPGQDHKADGDGSLKTANIVLDLSSGRLHAEAQDQPLAKGAENAPAGTQNFGDMLAAQLNEGLSSNIVQQASILVRDGGAGLIKLSLKPESLGNVKIRLEMADNKITGHIIVESDEAMRAFNHEMAAMEQAFRDSGFAGASLDMAMAGSGAQGQGTGQQWQNNYTRTAMPAQLVSASYDAGMESPSARPIGGFGAESLVNVLV